MSSTVLRVLHRYAGAAALLAGLLSGCGGGGGGTEAISPPVVSNAAPKAVVLLSGPVSAGGGNGDAATFTNSVVTLDGASSSDPEGETLGYRWSVVSRPQGSSAELSGQAAQASFKADLPGAYVLNLRVSDSRGAYSDKQVTLMASSNPPVTTLSLKVSYSATPEIMAKRDVSTSAIIVFDAGGSTDADGDPVTTSWELIERPAASRAALTIDGSQARFTADVVGLYKVRARGADPSGAYSEVVYPVEAVGDVPRTVITATVMNLYGNLGTGTATASLNDVVSLSGANSRDPEGQALTYSWVLSRKPEGSAARMSALTGAYSQFTPDVLGDYLVILVTQDPNGGASSYEMNVSVRNRRPEAIISSSSSPVALPTGPALPLPVGTTLTLRGNGSVDADGDTLTYAWSLASKPADSVAALSGTTGSSVQLTTDKAGRYQVRLRVTDTNGAYSEKLLNIDSGNASPVAVTDKSSVTVLTGAAMTASAALSYDDDNDGLSYSWAIDARPLGSNAAVAAPNAAQLAFTPDVAGTYVASVTVSDGKSAGIAYVTINALSSATRNVSLGFTPLEVRYSRGLDRLVAYAANPNALHIIDPFTGTTRQVALPLSVKSFNLSANGKLAAVLHEGVVSLVDIESATLIRSSLTNGSQTDAFPTNAGLIHMVGTNATSNMTPVSMLNGRTGADLTSYDTYYGSGHFYGTQRGIVAHTLNKTFVSSTGVSPIDISYFTINPASGALVSVGDSPYHGGYSMGSPFFLSANEDLLFVAEGHFYRTDTLRYAGRLSMSGRILSMSHSSVSDEALVLTTMSPVDYNGAYTGTLTYPSSYQRFRGALFLPDADIALPLIGGEQSYGLGIYHSTSNHHVALVQTGSASKDAAGIKYYLVTR